MKGYLIHSDGFHFWFKLNGEDLKLNASKLGTWSPKGLKQCRASVTSTGDDQFTLTIEGKSLVLDAGALAHLKELLNLYTKIVFRSKPCRVLYEEAVNAKN